MAAPGRLFFGYSFADFVIAAVGQLSTNGRQRYFQIGGDSLVKFRHDT
jgi:hypothetical protein